MKFISSKWAAWAFTAATVIAAMIITQKTITMFFMILPFLFSVSTEKVEVIERHYEYDTLLAEDMMEEE